MNTLPAVPDLAAGTVIELRKEDWRYGGHPLRLRVEQVRHDLSHYYRAEWVWIIGEALDQTGVPGRRVEALVRVSSLAAGADRALPGGPAERGGDGRGRAPGDTT